MRLIKKIWKNELIKGSLMLFVGMNLFNFFNFLFHFISARLLGPFDYGILATIMGMIYVFNIPTDSIRTIVSRYSTKLKKDKGKLHGLLSKALKKFFLVGFASFIVFILLSSAIGKFLFIDYRLILLTGIVFLFSFLLPITQGMMQGLKRFREFGFAFFSNGIIKLVLATSLILVGWKVFGALIGIIMGMVFTFFISLVFLRDIIKDKKKKTGIKGVYSYSIPVLVSSAAITILYSLDLILAKRFFPSEIVGRYAVISILGKIIFFGTFPISRAMFPLVSERNDEKQSSGDLLKRSLLFVGLLSAVALFFYYFFPKMIIFILYGSQYTGVSNLLIYPAIAMTLLSLTNIFISYNLSTNKKNFNYLIIFFVLLQVILLFLFHETLMQFISMIILANLITLFGFLLIELKFK